MTMTLKTTLIAAAMLIAGAAHATALDQFKSFVAGTKSARGEFTQTQVRTSGKPGKTSSGTFVFARPGKFIWTYQKPYEQLLQADGDTLYLYDKDLNQVTTRKLGGALGRPPAVPNAVGNRDAAFTLSTLALGTTPVLDALAEWSTGGRYVNFLSGPDTAHEEWVRACWTPEAHARLTALKRAYDPQNLFRVNHNIPPVPDRGIRHDH